MLNNELNIIIDDFESEWIEGKDLSKAIRILESTFIKEEIIVIDKLKEMICLAIKNKTCVVFDF